MGNICCSGDNILVYNGIPYSSVDINKKKVIESGLNEITITNCEYGEAYMVICGKKYLDGKESGIPFEFCIAQVNDDGIRGAILQKVSNNKDGNFSFNPVNYTKPGIYNYEVWENSHFGGYISDATVYSVKVVVQKDSQNNKLILDETSSEIPVIVFNNTTRIFIDDDPDPTPIPVPEPVDPAEPAEPEQPAKPEKPTKPEKPSKPYRPDTEVPKTGDTASDNMLLSLFMLTLSAFGGLVIWFRKADRS